MKERNCFWRLKIENKVNAFVWKFLLNILCDIVIQYICRTILRPKYKKKPKKFHAKRIKSRKLLRKLSFEIPKYWPIYIFTVNLCGNFQSKNNVFQHKKSRSLLKSLQYIYLFKLGFRYAFQSREKKTVFIHSYGSMKINLCGYLRYFGKLLSCFNGTKMIFGIL